MENCDINVQIDGTDININTLVMADDESIEIAYDILHNKELAALRNDHPERQALETGIKNFILSALDEAVKDIAGNMHDNS